MRKGYLILKVIIAAAFMSIMVMGCRKTEAAEEKIYRFSDVLGFQETKGPIWYEMKEVPLIIENEDQKIIIQNVLWKDQEVIFYAEFENYPYMNGDGHDKLVNQILIYSKDQKRTKTAHASSATYNDSDELDTACLYFDYQESADEIAFDLFGKKYVVAMQPIKEYTSLDQVGVVQTHNGRSIVIRDDESNRTAYTYSDDIWKIAGMEDIELFWLYYGAGEETRKTTKVPKIQWSSMNSFERGAGYRCIDETIKEADSFDIPAVRLNAKCEDLQIPLTLSEGIQKVNIPFSIGNDQYRISEIEVKPGLYDMSDNDKECMDVCIRIESVNVEKGTKLYGIGASLGIEEDVVGQVYDSTTGESENKIYGKHFFEIGSTYKGFPEYFFTEDFDKMEPVICIKIDKTMDMPDEVILKIKEANKSWNHNFHFEMD